MSIISFERNDFMNIKDYIIQNFKDDNLETIEKAIDDSVNEYNEDTLYTFSSLPLSLPYLLFLR